MSMRVPLLLLATGLPALLLAQSPRMTESGEREIQGGLSGVYFRPHGELAALVGSAGGYGAHGILQSPGHPLSLRLDYRRIIYGAHSYQRSYYDRKAKERVDVDSSVSNNIRSFMIGPQLILPFGPLRPYAGIAIGASIASTEWDRIEHREEDDDDSDCDEDDSSDSSMVCLEDLPAELLPNLGQILGGHWTGSFTRTVGVVIPVNVGRSQWAIDVGVTEHRNGRTSIRREGDPRRHRSDLRFRTIQVGVTLR
jgi:hypothetical protein